MRFNSYLLAILFTISLFNLEGQEILISKDIDIRNYFSYNIVGLVNDRLILYRDQGFIKEIDVFDLNMKHKFNAQLNLEDKKALIHEIVAQDSQFQIIYSYSDQDSVITSSRIFNERVELIDSSRILYKKDKTDIKSRFETRLSEDKNILAVFHTDKDKYFDVSVVDLRQRKLLFSHKYQLPDIDVVGDFLECDLSNSGILVVLFDQSSSKYKRERHEVKLMRIAGKNADIGDLNFEENLLIDLHVQVDNLNQKLFIAGLYNKKGDSRVDGLYMFNKRLDNLKQNETVNFINFDESFIQDVASTKKKSQKQLEYFNLNNIVLRRDGGALLFAEMNKIYNRRNPYTGVFPSSRDTYGRRGWTDYYNEDIMVLAYNSDHQLEWRTTLYKKQFSQDDDGVFSSYFLFKTPNRIRILYNDEIKKNNTVSEYMLDPLGNQVRNSLLSTDYQNLKLRFTGAVQISSTAMIVPSETSYKVNLVKIEY